MLMMPSEQASKWIFRLVLATAIFGFGFVAGKAMSFPSFSIENKVNLVDATSILVTIFVAWYISVIIEKEKEEGRTEKNLILKRTDEVCQLIDRAQQRVNTGSFPLQEATSSLKRVYISLKTISKILIQTRIKTDVNVRNEITACTRRLRELLTSTPINGSSNTAVKVIDGVVHLSQNRIAEIENEFDKLKDNILLLEISINKA